MDSTAALLIFVTGGGSISLALWQAARYNNPAVRWRKLAKDVELAFEDAPPRLSGRWKNRDVALRAEEKGAVLAVPLRAAANLRLELGPKEEIERTAGIVVPDRLSFEEDLAFSEAFLVRSTPKEAGLRAIDPTVRRKALALKQFHLLATSTQLEIRVSIPREREVLEELLDLAVTLAEVMEG